jgi:hypothetical protein
MSPFSLCELLCSLCTVEALKHLLIFSTSKAAQGAAISGDYSASKTVELLTLHDAVLIAESGRLQRHRNPSMAYYICPRGTLLVCTLAYGF